MTFLALGLLLGAAWSLGGVVSGALPALRLAAGLGLSGLLLGLLALVGQLAWAPVALVGLTCLAVVDLARRLRRRGIPFPKDRLSWIALLAIAAVALACLGALAPVTDDDSLSYPIPIARHLAEEGRWRFWPDQLLGVLPLTQQLLTSQLVSLGGTRLGVVSAVELCVGVAILLTIGRRTLFGEGTPWLAVVIAFAHPAAAFLSASAKEDLLLSAETLGCLYGLLCCDGARGAVLTGLFAGLAAGSKYTGLAVAVGALVATLVKPGPLRVRLALLFAGMALASGGLWYIVNVVRFGNPVPPFLSPPLPSPLDPSALAGTVHRFRIGSLPEFFLAPVRMFLLPGEYGGKGNLLNPLVLLALPGLYLADCRRRFRAPYLIAAAFYAAWFVSLHNERLLLPAAVVLSLPAASILTRLSHRGRLGRAFITACAVGSLAVFALIPGLRIARYVRDPATYLSRETQNYADIAWMNGNLTRSKNRVATSFRASAYLEVPWLVLDPTYQSVISPKDLATVPAALEALRRAKITHLHLAKGFFPDLERSLELVHENPSSRLGGTRLLHEPYTIATAIYAVPVGATAPAGRTP